MKNLLIALINCFAFSFLLSCTSGGEISRSEKEVLTVEAQPTIIEAKLKLVNTTPYLLNVAYSYPVNIEKSVTTGWWNMNPGDSLTVSEKFIGIEPSFSVFAQSASPSLIRWVYGLGKEISDEDATLYFPGSSEPNISYFCVSTHEAFRDTSNCIQPELISIPFVNVSVNQNNEALWVFSDYTFAGIYSQDTDNEVHSWANKAKVLSVYLGRQQSFESNFPDPSTTFPYFTGFVGDDFNGADMPGVILTEVEPFTIRGDSIPLRENDILIDFGGHPVFSMSDVYQTLWEFGNSIDKGIGEPVQFKIVRDGMIIEGRTLFFFNEGYFQKSSYGELLAAGYGSLNSITWGLPEYVPVGTNWVKKLVNWSLEDSENFTPLEVEDDKLVKWRYVQSEYLLRQLYPKYFNLGGFVGLFISPGGAFMKKPLQKAFVGRILPKGIISRVTSSVIVEIGEGIAWNMMDRSPIESNEQLIRRIRDDLPYSVGVGIITGTLGI